ncbi:MAG: DUF1854 domain-containing protein [Clostridia bacterium]|nr:DUF1854 domain-containing protein [Clostridia bacterium]
MKNDFKEAANIRYLTSKDIKFYETKGGLLGAALDGEDVGRCDVLRLFPLHKPDSFLSVRRQAQSHRDRATELGIIESLDSFTEEEKALILHELEKRYFVPEIIKVKNAKEEFGHTYWEVETNAGERSFTTFDMSASLVRIDANSVLLIDVDGSRYLIPDLKKADDKAMKMLDIWL